MHLYLVPCNALSGGNFCAEDKGLIMVHNEAQGTERRLRILLSYHYYKDTDLDKLFAKYFTPPYPEVFLDSGAFSAVTQGASISLREYQEYIKRFAHLFTTYAVLDVIGDAAATWENQQKMEAAGFAPLPAFHVGEDFSYLARYTERYGYIALGGMVPYMRFAKKMLFPWLIKAFKLAKDKSVFHGFGATGWDVVKAFPWYSVDSSSWGQGFRFGQVPVFDEAAGRFIKLQLGSPKEWYKAAALVRRLGFDPADFAERKRNDRAKMCAIAALSYMMAESWLQRRHGLIYIPQHADEAGLKSHLAVGGVLSAKDADYYPRGLADANDAGLKLHLAAGGDSVTGTAPLGGNMSVAALSQSGIKFHLADTSNGINYGSADKGLKMFLADTSPVLDTGSAMRAMPPGAKEP